MSNIPLRATHVFSNSPPSGWDTSSENFLFLKCSCGSCAAPLPDGHFKTKKFSQQKKVVPLHHFSKTFFPHHLQNGSAQARARVTKNTNTNPNLGIHVVCIHVVELWTAQWHDLNSFFNMKSIIRYCCSAERIFEAPCSYNDAALTYLATVTIPNRGLGPMHTVEKCDGMHFKSLVIPV